MAVRKNLKLRGIYNGFNESLSRFDCHLQILILNGDLNIITQFFMCLYPHVLNGESTL